MIIMKAYWSPVQILANWFSDPEVPTRRKVLGSPFVAFYFIFALIGFAGFLVGYVAIILGSIIFTLSFIYGLLEPWFT